MSEQNPYEQFAGYVNNEYESVYNSSTEEAIKSSAVIASDKSPDQHAKVVSLAEKFGARSDFVEENYNDLAKKKEDDELNLKLTNAIKTNPKTTDYFSNPDLLSIAKDDIDELMKLESSINEHSFTSQAYNALGAGFAKTYENLAKAPAYIGNVSLIPSNIIRKSIGEEQVGYEIDNRLSDYYKKAGESFLKGSPATQESITNLTSKGEFAKAGQTIALQVIQNAPQQIALLGSAMAGFPAVGLGMAGVTTAADKASELQNSGVEPLQATTVAAANGTIEAAFESLGTMGILKSWEMAIAKDYGKSASKEVMFGLGKTFAYSVLSEGNEEAATSLAQDFTDYVTGVNPDAMKGSIQRAIDAGVVGGFSGGLMTAPSGALMAHQKIKNQQQIKADQNLYLAIGDVSEKSKLKQRLPEKYRDLVDNITKEGPVENVYLNAEGFTTYFQNKNINPTQIAQELGIQEEYNNAIETGTDIKIKTSVMAEKLAGTEHYQGLVNDIKFNPDHLTVNEQKIEDAKIKRDIEIEYENAKVGKTEEQVKSIEDSSKEVAKDVENQLKEIGYTPKSAKTNAALYESFFRVQGMKIGKMPEDLYKKYGLNISYAEQETSSEVDGEKYYQSRFGRAKVGQTSGSIVKSFGTNKHYNVDSIEFTNEDTAETASQKVKDLDKYLSNKAFEAIKLEPSAFKSLSLDQDQMNRFYGMLTENGYKLRKDGEKITFQKFKYGTVKTYKQENINLNEIKGSITFGDNRQFNISLFKAKDESTFLHESAHFFLEVLSDLSQAENATEQIKEDANTMLDWLGVKSFDEIQIEHHEKFARGFEQYLMKGEAPSDKLRKAFSAFKTWLLSIYKQSEALNVEVSKEMKGVFDRMLASEEEIDAISEQVPVKQMFGDPAIVGMSEEKMLDYLNAITFANIYAKDELRKKLMNDIIRKKDSAYRNRYNNLYDEAMKQAEQMVEFKTIKAITSDLKLSKPLIEKNYSVFKNSLPAKSTQVEDGQNPDVVASIFGYENGQAMLQAIAPYRRGIEFHVEQAVADKLKKEYPELLESPELSEEAIKAAYTEKHRLVKRLELEHLAKNDPQVLKDVAKRLIRRMPSDKAVKEQAVKIIAATNVREIKPHMFRSAEKRFAKEASDNYAKGEFDLAFEAKRKEYLNFELFRAATEARDDVKKSIKDFKKLFKSDEDLAKGRDVDLVNAARSILAEFGITRAEKTAEEYLSKVKQYDPEVYSVVKTLVDSATTNSGDYQNVKYEDFVEMRDTVESIFDLAKSRKEIEIDGVKKDIDEVVSDLNGRISEITPKELSEYSTTVDKWGLVKEKLLGAKASLVRAEHWSIAMGGNFHKYIYQPISDAVVKYRLKKVDVMKKYMDIVKEYEKNISYDSIISDELKFIFKDKSELMMAILHTGNESNKRKLLLGRGWASLNEDGSLDTSRWDSFIDRINNNKTGESILKKEDYDFAQKIWDLLEELKPDAQKAHKQMYGYYFNEITSKTFSTPYGEYRGGYIPAKADVYSVEDAKIRKEREEFENNNNSFQYPTAGRGFTKSRVENYTVPLSLDINLLGSHIDGVMRFTYIEPRVKELSRVVMDKGFRSAISKIDSNIAADMLIPWLQRTAQQKVMLPSQDGLGRATDAVARILRKNVATQIMFGSVTNTLQQTTGIIVAASKVKPKYLRNALWRYVTNNKETVNSIMEKSDWVKTTQGENIFEIHNSVNEILLNPSVFEKAQNFTRQHTYFLQSAAQNMVNNVVFSAAYEQAIENGMTENDAVKEADSVVRTTQGTNSPEDISRFETGTATEMLFKQFVGYFNMIGNLNSSELIKIQREVGLRKGAGKAFYIYLTAFMLPAVVADFIAKAMSGKFDEDDDDSYLDDMMSSFFGSQFKTFAATIPYGGQLAVAAYNKYFTDSLADDRLSLSPVISILESTVTSPIDIYKTISQNGDIKKKTVKDALQFVGTMTGLPVGPIGKPAGYLIDVNEGKAKPDGPVDFTRGLITGKSGN